MQPGRAGKKGTADGGGRWRRGAPIVGVLGISRSTTGGSRFRRGAYSATGRPHARYSPFAPAPQRAIRRPIVVRDGRSPGGPRTRPPARPGTRRPDRRPEGDPARQPAHGAGRPLRGHGRTRPSGRGVGRHQRRRGTGDGGRAGGPRRRHRRHGTQRPAGAWGREPFARYAEERPGRERWRDEPDVGAVEDVEQAGQCRARAGRPTCAPWRPRRLLAMSPPKSCPRPGKVPRSRRKLGSDGAPRRHPRPPGRARDRTVAGPPGAVGHPSRRSLSTSRARSERGGPHGAAGHARGGRHARRVGGPAFRSVEGSSAARIARAPSPW